MKRLLVTAIAGLFAMTALNASAADMKIRIGVEGAYPPFSYVDTDGSLKGFDIDIANALCETLNAECTLVQQDWDGIIPALLARKYDAIIASMSITEERKKAVDFTNKYYNTPARFIAPKGTEIKFLTEGDESMTITDASAVSFNTEALAGKSIGVQRATTHDNFLTEVFGDSVDIKRYATQDEVYLDLASGRIDMAVQDSVAALDGFLNTEDGKDFTFVGPALADPKYHGEGAGIAVRKGEDELREALNNAIRTIRENGTYQEINNKYFDFDVYGGES